MKRLTQKQRQFAMAYVETGNRVEAYWRAYNCAGMNDKTVRRKAQEVGALPHVAAKIGELQKGAADRSKLKVDDLVAEYRRIAFSSIADFVDVRDGVVTARDLNTLPPEQRACIRKFKVNGNGQVEVELHDKVHALHNLAKHLGMFEKKLPEPERVLINLNMGAPPEGDPPRTGGKKPWRRRTKQIPAKTSARQGDVAHS